MVLDTHRRWPDGVQLTVKRLRRAGCNIGYTKVYQILKSNGLVTASPAKSRQRKWVRYERLYSNAMWHTDWHTMKDPRMRGLNLITYLDDASRCVTGAALFKEATSENAAILLRQAVGRFGTPATILSDNGSCFVGAGGRKKPKGTWTPTLFENELLSLDIGLINSSRTTRRPTASWSGSTGVSKTRYGAMAAWTTTSNTTTPTGCTGRWTSTTTRRP